MLTKQQFSDLLNRGPLLLDGATGSNLQKMGMPRGCCTEEWILNHPEAILDLQRRYAAAGSQVVYAPTFQAQPIPLSNVKLDKQTESINAMLVALSKQAAPGLLVAGDLTTMATFIDSYDTALFDTMVENYRRQIAGLLEGGGDPALPPGCGGHSDRRRAGGRRNRDVHLHHAGRWQSVFRPGGRSCAAGAGTGWCRRCGL